MDSIAVAAVTVNQLPFDWEANTSRIISGIKEAKSRGAKLVCLPELAISGYNCEDFFLSKSVCESSWQSLLKLLPSTIGLAVCVGLPFMHRGRVYNCAAMLVDGEVVGLTAKRYLPGDGVHYEPRWFKSANLGEVTETKEGIPFGDVWFDFSGITVGVEICEDSWVPSRPASFYEREGIDVILSPSASHFSFGKINTRRQIALESSRRLNSAYVYANLLGCESGVCIYDGDRRIVADSQVVSESSRFSFSDYEVTCANVDVTTLRNRTSLRYGGLKSIASENDAKKLSFNLTSTLKESVQRDRVVDLDSTCNFLDFTNVEALGLFDYLRKSSSSGFVVSLSGGADSTAVVFLAWYSIYKLFKVSTVQEIHRRAPSLKWIKSKDDFGNVVSTLLKCVYQKTEQSSSTTLNSASSLAGALGLNLFEWDINGLVGQYTTLVEGSLKKKFDWKTDDIALQNIQTRVRVPALWMLANSSNSLLLATGNRSEASVGYATMDGDTAGGLSPIGGVAKSFIKDWLLWLQEKSNLQALGISEDCYLNSIPSALSLVTQQSPTAELRPLAMNQTDEDDLMPYEVLNSIETLAIRDKLSREDIIQRLKVRFSENDFYQENIENWTSKFFKLWSRSQWKRVRLATSFMIDEYSVDYKSWCRFPVLSKDL